MIFNQIKTVLLLGALTGLMLLAGNLMGGRLGLTVALIFALLMNGVMYFFSDKIVLWMYKAKEVKDKNSHLYKVIKEVSESANIPMPRVYIIEQNTPNAFATGRNFKNAAVACTTGILDLLDKEELKGVIAHEIAHIRNRDILITTIAATIAAVIVYLANMAQFAAIFGSSGDRERGSTNVISLLVLAILTPLIATIIQLAISRSREYIADESGARIIKNPKALASALSKLERGNRINPLHIGNKATSSLFIVNPFRGEALLSLFSTHPPLNKRVEKLNALVI